MALRIFGTWRIQNLRARDLLKSKKWLPNFFPDAGFSGS
ncbi:hypothetical protein SC1_01480 [Sphingopyxis sp. C-1]|nr:hypothetical protein SC1_01480 [Sphingopyxis sp. C-1]